MLQYKFNQKELVNLSTGTVQKNPIYNREKVSYDERKITSDVPLPIKVEDLAT
jgi:hypothetical protein